MKTAGFIYHPFCLCYSTSIAHQKPRVHSRHTCYWKRLDSGVGDYPSKCRTTGNETRAVQTQTPLLYNSPTQTHSGGSAVSLDPAHPLSWGERGLPGPSWPPQQSRGRVLRDHGGATTQRCSSRQTKWASSV